MSDKPKVKEIPMLFTDEMANACRTGIKTETRRLRGLDEINKNPDNWEFKYPEKDRLVFLNKEDGQLYYMKNHYGQEGDVIWVREAWKGTMAPVNDKPCPHIQYRSDNSIVFIPTQELEWFHERFTYGKFKWEPNMFLRRVFARTFLRRTFTKCERLMDITDEAAIKEGIIEFTKDETVFKYGLERWEWAAMPYTAVKAYQKLWESINGPDSWKANPWVVIVGFTKIENYEAQ